MIKQSILTAAVLAAACCAPAFAQDQAKPDRIVLEAKVGNVMTSTGGDFSSAAIGKQLANGESMMLNDGAQATVVYYYDNDKRKCVENYAGPNTFVIDDGCDAAAAFIPNMGVAGTVLTIGGVALAAALLTGVAGGDTVPPPPVSAGAL